MDHEIRTIEPGELEAYVRCVVRAFHGNLNRDRLDFDRSLFEFDRNLAAFDGREVIGTTGAFTTQMTVPGGGSLTIAAVTDVSVNPAYRRQGVASALLRTQLAQVRERGEPFAALWASEAPIYGRYGYGIASQRERLTIPRAHAALRSDLPKGTGRTRLLALEEARVVLPPLHERLRRQQAGELARWPEWWEARIFQDDPAHRDGFTASEYVLYEEAGELAGYARYRTKEKWDDAIPVGELLIQEMYASTPEARVALYRYLLNVDLIATIEEPFGDVDGAVLAMLVDPRRAVRRTSDGIWIRIMDVARAFSARALAFEGRLRFALHDPEWGSGRFEIEGGPEGAICRETTVAPDLELGPEALAHLYLGGGRLHQLNAAGRVTGPAETLAYADALLGWFQPPRCQEDF